MKQHTRKKYPQSPEAGSGGRKTEEWWLPPPAGKRVGRVAVALRSEHVPVARHEDARVPDACRLDNHVLGVRRGVRYGLQGDDVENACRGVEVSLQPLKNKVLRWRRR